MDERDDYAEDDRLSWLADPQRCHEVARNVLVVGVLVGFALMIAGVTLVAIYEVRRGQAWRQEQQWRIIKPASFEERPAQ